MVIQKDYTGSRGGEALGARLRRISESIDRDATQSYSLVDVKFEQRWCGILDQLTMNGPMSVSDISSALRITHVSVSQARQSLEKKGFIYAKSDKSDARRRELMITPSGEILVRRLQPLWEAQRIAASKLNDEVNDLIAVIDEAEKALERKSLLVRIEEELQHLKM